MKINFHNNIILLLSVLAVLSFLLLNKCDRVEVVEKCTVDTLVIVKVDTIRVPKYIEKRIIDTIYIETKNKDNLALEVVQKYYASKNLYDIWVSGVEPLSLDSVNIYSKTEYRTITKELVREIYPKEWRVYVGGGFNAFSRTLTPELSISLATPKKWLITANLGIYEGSLFYGGSISCKIK